MRYRTNFHLRLSQHFGGAIASAAERYLSVAGAPKPAKMRREHAEHRRCLLPEPGDAEKAGFTPPARDATSWP